jgi:hypothetical protein
LERSLIRPAAGQKNKIGLFLTVKTGEKNSKTGVENPLPVY